MRLHETSRQTSLGCYSRAALSSLAIPNAA